MSDSDERAATPPAELRDRTTGRWMDQERVPQVKRFHEFSTIDWVEDELDNHRQSVLKNQNILRSNTLVARILSLAQNWMVLALMGVIIGVIAGVVNIITAWLASTKTGHCSSGFYISESFCCPGGEHCDRWNTWTGFAFANYIIFIVMSVTMSLISALLVKFYSPAAAGSGISEIKCIVSGFVMKGFLGWWTLLIKSVGLPLAIASGLSLGKEGPSVHYAVCVGNCIAKLFTQYRKSASRAREFLTAASAAGVAVAFGSPMGGVLFSVEEISSVFRLTTIWKSYFCALVAVMTLAAINPFRTGQLVLFEVVYDSNWHIYDIPVYILLGVFGGFYGIIVSKFNIRVVAFRKKYLGNFAIREVAILSFLTAVICYFNEFLRSDMTESMQILFHECDANFEHRVCSPKSNKTLLVVSLLFATFMRMLLTIITYGCKVPAGIFVPSMAAGATFGRALGILLEEFYKRNKDSIIFRTCTDDKCVIPGTYAFLGAAAGLSGITDLTVTVVIIMFELTGALRYIIPTMIVVAVTKIINDKWGKGGIADQMIPFNGLPLIDSNEEFKFDTTVTSAMSPATVVIPSNGDELITISSIQNILDQTTFRGFPLVESLAKPKINGYIARSDLLFVLNNHLEAPKTTPCEFRRDNSLASGNEINLSSLVNSCPLTISAATTLEYVAEIFVKLGPRYILIEDNGTLVGIITRKDVLRYEHTIHRLQAPDSEIQLTHEAFDARVWEIMNLLSTNLKKTIGKLLHNDASRYV